MRQQPRFVAIHLIKAPKRREGDGLRIPLLKIAAHPCSTLRRPVLPQSPAYVCYNSG